MAFRYGVIGTGALGGFYGGMLARAGREVHFLLRSDYDHVRRLGLRVDSVLGDFHLDRVRAYPETGLMPECDILLVCLKTTSNPLLPELLRPLLGAGGVVLLLQNGLEVEEDLQDRLPAAAIAGGLAFVCCHKVGPGHVRHLDYGALTLGAHGRTDPEIVRLVAADFRAAGVQAECTPDLAAARWRKLVWNVPFNGLTVVMDTTTDRLVRHEASRRLVREIMLEVIHGAGRCGAPLPEALADEMIEQTLRMTPYAPSMKLDYDHGRPMEIETIYSRPVQAAARSGLGLPRISSLEWQLRFLQDFRGDRGLPGGESTPGIPEPRVET